MISPQLAAQNCLSPLPIYVPLNASLDKALNIIKEHGLSKIAVTDAHFSIIGSISKDEIEKFLLENKIKKPADCSRFKVSDAFDPDSKLIAAYPTTNLKELRRIMTITKSNYLPIVKNPWNKVLIGFVSLKQIAEVV